MKREIYDGDRLKDVFRLLQFLQKKCFPLFAFTTHNSSGLCKPSAKGGNTLNLLVHKNHSQSLYNNGSQEISVHPFFFKELKGFKNFYCQTERDNKHEMA